MLRVRSSEQMKRSAQQSVVSEREKRPKSKSRPKSKKKSTKIDAKMPKKPPTAFFFFSCEYSLYIISVHRFG